MAALISLDQRSVATAKCELRYLAQRALAKKGEFHEFREFNKCRHFRQDNKTHHMHSGNFFITIHLLFDLLRLR